MKISLPFVLGAIAISVVAGLIVNYLSKSMLSPGSQCAGSEAQQNALNAKGQPNYNRTGANPASTYPVGAPVTNYRPYLRVGQVEVPAS